MEPVLDPSLDKPGMIGVIKIKLPYSNMQRLARSDPDKIDGLKEGEEGDEWCGRENTWEPAEIHGL